MGSGRAGDRAIAGGTAAIVLATELSSGQHVPSALDPLGYMLLAASGLVLVARRRFPITMLVAAGACVLAYQAIGFAAPAVAYLVAVYATVRAGHRIVTAAVSLVMLAAVPLALLVAPDGRAWGEVLLQARDVLPLAWLIAAGAAGEALRQAERRADEAERTREEAARRGADEERLHIARELHDSLTHQISVITVQAEAAVHVARRRGEEVPGSLLAIREAGREASRELRATLEALRAEDQGPAHGLGHVPDLVQRARLTGLEATLTIDGQPRALSGAVDRTGYRIVQESLTNVARHAGAGTASVRIDYRADVLVIRVDDDGRATPDAAPVPGVGLLGMRERVTALGGHLHAAPRDGGGFSIRAELPAEQPS